MAYFHYLQALVLHCNGELYINLSFQVTFLFSQEFCRPRCVDFIKLFPFLEIGDFLRKYHSFKIYFGFAKIVFFLSL